MRQAEAELVERSWDGVAWTLRIRALEIAGALRPGQALLLRGAWGPGTYLRRVLYPIAIRGDEFWVRVAPGDDYGEAWLAAAPPGTYIDCLGPVGKGFVLSPGVRNLLCVAEGNNGWLLLPAVEQAVAAGVSVTLALECASARQAVPSSALPPVVEYRVATLDGSLGVQGRLGASVPDLVGWADGVFAAGSPAFYTALASAIERARFRLPRDFAQVLYFAPILCGVGSCMACVSEVAGGRRRVCLRGPVFDLADVVAR